MCRSKAGPHFPSLLAMTSLLLGLQGSLFAHNVHAEPNCNDLISMVNHAEQRLAAATDEQNTPRKPKINGADQCASATGEGGSEIYYCSWQFPFRSGEARQLFTQLDAQVDSCLNTDSASTSDQPVNHPDSFWLNTYQLEKSKLSISVKDKSSLGKSLLFLRVQILPPSG